MSDVCGVLVGATDWLTGGRYSHFRPHSIASRAPWQDKIRLLLCRTGLWLVGLYFIERSAEASNRAYFPMMAVNSNTFCLRASTFPPEKRCCRCAINKMAFSTWSEY